MRSRRTCRLWTTFRWPMLCGLCPLRRQGVEAARASRCTKPNEPRIRAPPAQMLHKRGKLKQPRIRCHLRYIGAAAGNAPEEAAISKRAQADQRFTNHQAPCHQSIYAAVAPSNPPGRAPRLHRGRPRASRCQAPSRGHPLATRHHGTGSLRLSRPRRRSQSLGNAMIPRLWTQCSFRQRCIERCPMLAACTTGRCSTKSTLHFLSSASSR